MLGNHVLKQCPVSLIDEWADEMVNVFMQCHFICPIFGSVATVGGFLPESGGYEDQSNIVMQIFSVIRSAILTVKPKKV